VSDNGYSIPDEHTRSHTQLACVR